MTKEEMINAIYDEMADETLSDGCTVRTSDGIIRTIGTASTSTIRNGDTIYFGGCGCCEESDEVGRYTTIGHPVLIGDVIEYIRLKNIWDINPITDEWDYPRLPIEEQGDDTIAFVYNLINK